ncbi:hypothetical protein HHL16_16075 [Pseudoflavitalea sp. G-6-1-2]|uniref:hypothetical protein n=1 Tax=Pseudoflavitalea sp. G-6-1-2 TaxID=2728841 RepID=UPI00146E7504|nr:hypothetical protein [Pseudoflavitalea sp. G-6-1-2]NML22402.1 hypothetical protein [Pseudoflavitalea sp. G-6-1-2]
MKITTTIITATALSAIAFYACKKSDNKEEPKSPIEFKNHSITPALIKKQSGFDNLELFTLFSSEDVFAQSPGYVFGGSADGSGTIKNPNGEGYVMLVNNEDNYSLSKITFDKTFKPVKGEYLLNSDAGQWRLCSGTMATVAENGFGPFYLCVGESSTEAQVHKIDPAATGIQSNTATAGLGHWSGENAVPLNKDAYPGKTVIIIGEDDDSKTGGQVVMYVSNTVGNLDNGKQYMLKRTDGNQKETDIRTGSTYDVEFVEIENYKTLTGTQIQDQVDPLKAIKFGRVEDVDYKKGGAAQSREIYFNATGQAATGENADNSRTVKGRVYRLILDAANPLKGKLECILDGDEKTGPAKAFQNPDNICVTQNYVYIQEDANSYGDETHDAYIYQYNIASKELKVVFELDHRRDDPKFKATAAKGNWEYGSLVDISDVIGVPNTFTLCIQPHTWKTDAFKNADKGTKRASENQGSEVILIKGLPR